MPVFEDHRIHIQRLFAAALEAADPVKALNFHWPPDLDDSGPIYLVGAGKAALEMASAVGRRIGDRLGDSAVAVVPDRLASTGHHPGLNFYPAAHPIPDQRNLTASKAIERVARQGGESDTLLVLLSGGGSAHLAYPAPGLTLDHIGTITAALLRGGAVIAELNAVRKHVEVLKGGGLAKLAYPARTVALILSDVLGDPLDVIASGPAAPDPTTYADALKTLDRFDLLATVPELTARLQRGASGDLPETLKPGDPVFERVTSILIGSNRLAVEAVVKGAERLGFRMEQIEHGVEGEASEVGRELARRAKTLAGAGEAACIVLGGETTVTVTGSGRGGRNTEMALAAALEIEGIEKVAIFTFATDGVDGPTDAAGGQVSGETAGRIRSAGLDPLARLAENDSYSALQAADALIQTGPTGTNVNDVAVALVYPPTP